MPWALGGMSDIITSDEFSVSLLTRIWRAEITRACNVFSSDFLFSLSPCRHFRDAMVNRPETFTPFLVPFLFSLIQRFVSDCVEHLPSASPLNVPQTPNVKHSSLWRGFEPMPPANLMAQITVNDSVTWKSRILNYWACGYASVFSCWT